ncbi:MAG: 3',5'-cyclic-nucleotide phosphodiesterase [Zetaproteobacteria bacterium]|nr:MAG: 3',5'-cyclic-nucleotide phosphodiesterase [Zetaproteobacteria bacterium]
MRIRVLGCYGGQLLGFHLSSFLLNDAILLDAGAPTESLTLEEQHRIRHIFISHVHLDHIKDIAFLADNRSLKRIGGARDNRKMVVHALPENLEYLRKHFLNNIIWPDFTTIPSPEDPILELRPFRDEEPVEVEGVRITPIRVNHPVPCTAFLVDEEGVQFLYSADTGPTGRMWEIANAQPGLQGVIIDCSFPNSQKFLADLSGHMTPRMVGCELREKFHGLGTVPIYLFHMKPEELNLMTDEIGNEALPLSRMLTQIDELIL